MSEEDENFEVDPTDVMLDRCFNEMKSHGDSSPCNKKSDLALTVGNDG